MKGLEREHTVSTLAIYADFSFSQFLPEHQDQKDLLLYILPATHFMIDSASVLSLTESLSRSGKQYDKKDIALFSSYESILD